MPVAVATVPFTNIENLLDDGPFSPGPDGTVDGEDTPENMGAGYDDSNAPNDGGGDAITPGDDDIDGNGGDDTIDGLAGDDDIDGGDDDDVLSGGAGDDTIDGGNDDDLIDGGPGADVMRGGDDDDTITIDDPVEAVGDIVDGGAGGTDNDTLDLRGAGPVEYVGLTPDSDGNGQDGVANILDPVTGAVVATVPFTNIENLLDDGPFSPGPDGIVDGEETGETMNLGYDDANAPTDNGGDLITTGDDIILGNGGSDTIRAANGDDTIEGGDDNDLIFGQGGNDDIIGEAGSDRLFGGAGNDTIDGGDDNDRLVGGSGADVILGGADSDTIRAGSAGQADGDIVDGGSAGDDNDTLDLRGAGQIRIVSQVADSNGNGTDGVIEIVDAAGATTATVTYSEIERILSDGIFDPGTGPDGVVDGEETGEVMGIGYDDANAPTDGGGDQITSGDDVIDGNGGDDTINASGGNDDIGGGAGNDLITGNGGSDTISGGRDADTIIIDDAADAVGDVIDGGSAGDDNDTLDLRGAGPVNFVGVDVDSDGNGFDGTVEILDPVTGAVVASVPFTNIENLLDDGPFTGGTNGIVDGAETGEVMNSAYVDFEGDAITSGDDIVQGNGGNDVINTNGGDDVIDGGDGKDTINAGSGDDVVNTGANEAGNLDEWEDVTLGTGSDILFFTAGNDFDRVRDFNTAEDQIDLKTYAFADVSDVLALATESTNRRGDSRVDIDLGDGDQIRLLDVTIADLDASNFIL